MSCYSRTKQIRWPGPGWLGVGRPNSAYLMSLGKEAQTHESMKLKGAAHTTKTRANFMKL